MAFFAPTLLVLGLAGLLGASAPALPLEEPPRVEVAAGVEQGAIDVAPTVEHGRADRGRGAIEHGGAAPSVTLRCAWCQARSWRALCELAAVRPAGTRVHFRSAARAPRRCAPRQRDDTDDH